MQQATVQLAHTGAAMASQAGSVETLERELRSKMVEYSSKLDHMLALEARLVEAQELLMAQESEINRLTNELRIVSFVYAGARVSFVVDVLRHVVLEWVYWGILLS